MRNVIGGGFGARGWQMVLAQMTAGTQPKTGATTSPVAVSWPWEKWLRIYDWTLGLRALITFVLIMALWWLLARIFRKVIARYRLGNAVSVAAAAIVVYATLFAIHPLLMLNPADMIAVTIHKVFAAVMVLVGIRFIDRLLVVPILTRVAGGAPSRFIHQIVITVISIFAIAGYCSIAFGIELGSLVAGSAVISIVLGLALQETLGNFFSGMVLQASVPFQPGDWIQIGDVEGRVVEMTWRAVTLLTGANNHVLLPNSSVAKERIVNYHAPTVATATSIEVGIDYAIPPNDVKRVLLEAAKDTPGVLATPEPGVALASFDESAITYKLIFWIDQPQKHGGVETAARVNVWYRLNQAGYGIPFPIRTVEMTDLDKKEAGQRERAAAQRLAVIKGSPIFGEMPAELQQQLAAETRDFALTEGQTFFRQNDPGDSLYILQSGTVGITVLGDGGREMDVAELAAPAVFGEVSAVTGQPRAATYRAKTEVRVIEVGHAHLQGLFTADPNFMNHLSQVVAERQKQREELLKKMGAAAGDQQQHTEQHTVLDRMKRMFTAFHR